jgi:hypothetical protein
MSTPQILQEIATKYLDGRKDAFWQHKQSGQWLIKHRDLEIAAGKAGMAFDTPTIIEADSTKCVAMVIVGRWDDKMEWSIGEASPKNTTQSYPYAMAEKRAKDRVILKLFGIHGHIYSEEESEEFKDSKAPSQVDYAALFANITDLNELKTSFGVAWASGNTYAKDAYDKRKGELGG